MSNKNTSSIYPLALMVAGAGLVFLSRKIWQPRLNLQGQVALITGGSRGLGLAMAEEFARLGARVAVCARDERELERARAILSEAGAGSAMRFDRARAGAAHGQAGDRAFWPRRYPGQ